MAKKKSAASTDAKPKKTKEPTRRQLKRAKVKIYKSDAAKKEAARLEAQMAASSKLTPNLEVLPPPRDLMKDFGKLTEKVGDFFKKNKWGRRSLYIGLTVVGLNMMRASIKHFSGRDRQRLPEDYDRGYDVLRESITDFGSPHKAKVAHKTMMPYYSTERKSRHTTVESMIAKNPALALSRQAIGHGRY